MSKSQALELLLSSNGNCGAKAPLNAGVTEEILLCAGRGAMLNTREYFHRCSRSLFAPFVGLHEALSHKIHTSLTGTAVTIENSQQLADHVIAEEEGSVCFVCPKFLPLR